MRRRARQPGNGGCRGTARCQSRRSRHRHRRDTERPRIAATVAIASRRLHEAIDSGRYPTACGSHAAHAAAAGCIQRHFDTVHGLGPEAGPGRIAIHRGHIRPAPVDAFGARIVSTCSLMCRFSAMNANSRVASQHTPNVGGTETVRFAADGRSADAAAICRTPSAMPSDAADTARRNTAPLAVNGSRWPRLSNSSAPIEA